MSDIEQTSFFKPAGRESRGLFWPFFLPYLAVFLGLFAWLLHSCTDSQASTADLLSGNAVMGGLLLSFLWVASLSGHLIRRMHDAGVSAFFFWLMLAMELLALALAAVFPFCEQSKMLASSLVIVILVVIPVLHIAISVFCCLASEQGTNAYGDSKANPGVMFKGTSWGGIIEDMLKLIVAMGILGGACNLAMKPFETVNETDSLVSLIRKGGVDRGKDAVFDKELKQGMDSVNDFINTKDNTGRTPLMWAVYSNFNNPDEARKLDLKRVFYVKALLASPGIRPSETDKDGFTALHWAAWSGMPACSLELVGSGLDLNAREGNGYTPLMLAAMRGNADTVEMLLKLGADAAATDKNSKTALQLVTGAEGAYSKRGDWKFYSLIFSDEREKAYSRTIGLLKNPPALVPMEELQAEASRKIQAAEAGKPAASDGAASVSSAEKGKEATVEEAAAAPAQTSPDQDPSADPQPLDQTSAGE